MAKSKVIDLVLIDPQEDFCNPKGALYVKGAEDDMARVAKFLKRAGDKLNDIHVTLDSHQRLHVAHPEFWVDSNGNHPAPLKTVITVDDVRNGKWVCASLPHQKRVLEYVEKLSSGKRYALVVWPPHCLIGTPGHAVFSPVSDALHDWCLRNFATIDYVTKGANPFTEHYSAVQAEVPDPQDKGSLLNMRLIQQLINADEIAVAGEAGSHCVANTLRDICNNFSDPSCLKKIVLLEGGFAPVPGFENLQDDFLKEMKQRGVRTARINDYLA
jgi:nicotinamidase-related amidase